MSSTRRPRNASRHWGDRLKKNKPSNRDYQPTDGWRKPSHASASPRTLRGIRAARGSVVTTFFTIGLSATNTHVCSKVRVKFDGWSDRNAEPQTSNDCRVLYKFALTNWLFVTNLACNFESSKKFKKKRGKMKWKKWEFIHKSYLQLTLSRLMCN